MDKQEFVLNIFQWAKKPKFPINDAISKTIHFKAATAFGFNFLQT